MLRRCLYLFLLSSAFSSTALGRVDYGKRAWNWKKDGKVVKFEAVLIKASDKAVVLGSKNNSGVARLRRFALPELSNADILYVQKWRDNYEGGIEKYRAALRLPPGPQRSALFKQSVSLGNPRAGHYVATNLAIHGDFEKARDHLGPVRSFYRSRLDFLPSLTQAFVAAENNFALTRLRARSMKSVTRSYKTISDFVDGAYPKGVEHNLRVFAAMAPKKDRTISRLLGDIQPISPSADRGQKTDVRQGWLYMNDDVDSKIGEFDRLCMMCAGKGHMPCPNNSCKVGTIPYKQTKYKTIRVGNRTQKVAYQVQKFKDCKKCVKGRVKCKACDRSRTKQFGGTIDERFNLNAR